MMRKVKNYIPAVLLIVLMLLLSALTSCSQADEPETASAVALSDVPVLLTATELSASGAPAYAPHRAGASVNNGTITSGETVTVKLSSDNATTFTYTAGSAGALNAPAPPAYYPVSGTVNIYAWYPSGASTTFTVNSDQSTDANYKASDLMFASVADQAKTTSTVNLPFAHKMAKIKVVASKGDGVTSILGVTLKNVKKTCSFGQTVGTDIGIIGTASGAAGDIIMCSSDAATTKTIAAVIPPQTLANGTQLLAITTNSGTANYSLGAAKTFAGGSEYTFNITVSARDVKLTNTITAWTDGDGGVPTSATIYE